MADLEKKKLPDAPASQVCDSPVLTSISKPLSRRGFVKAAVFATVAVSTSVGGAKIVSSILPKQNFQAQYDRDRRAGDRIIARTRLVEMSSSEKKGFVKSLVKGYKYKRSS